MKWVIMSKLLINLNCLNKFAKIYLVADECQKVWNCRYHSINFKEELVSSFEGKIFHLFILYHFRQKIQPRTSVVLHRVLEVRDWETDSKSLKSRERLTSRGRTGWRRGQGRPSLNLVIFFSWNIFLTLIFEPWVMLHQLLQRHHVGTLVNKKVHTLLFNFKMMAFLLPNHAQDIEF